MQEKDTLARPYAEAVFKQAQVENSHESWSAALNMLSQVVQDKKVTEIIINPQVTKNDLTNLLLGIVKDNFSATQQNLVKLLTANKRVSIAPEISKIFETLKAEAANHIAVEVRSAYELDEPARASLNSYLENKFERKVDMELQVDPELIGGVVIKAGDMVIDSSLKGQVAQLAAKVNI